MSDREFDNYLTLLSSLLRLRGKQRQVIAEELRSHLEDRLEELVTQGVAREAAIQQALAEFGDAAGLAGQFVAISQNRKRRWLVRVTTFSAAATLLIAASLITFWPGRNAAPGIATAKAQQAESKETVRAPRVADPVKLPAERIEAELNSPTNVDFVAQPLKDVLLFLSEQHQIPIFTKVKKLEEATLSLDQPVTINLKGVRLGTVLDLIFDELELTYFVKDVLIVTTPEDAEANLETRVYDCRDLLAMPAPNVPQPPAPRPAAGTIPPPPAATQSIAPPASNGVAGGGGAPTPTTTTTSGKGRPGMGGMSGGPAQQQPQTESEKRTDQLIDLITSTVRPDSWDDVGGPGAVDAYNGLFVISQTAKVHKEVEHVLDMLRQAAGLEAAQGSKVVR